jgi:mannan endo-1,4-beta-mannosidase
MAAESTRDTRGRLAAVAFAAALASGCVQTPVHPVVSPLDLKSSARATFELDGKPFCFAGANNYYPIYKPRPVVDNLFNAARALDLRVMRVWGMLDRGSLDGTVPNADPDGGDKEGVYFQYWDPAKKAPAYNDGEQGLERLDYVLAKAAELDLKIIVVLVNNWRPFGGIDQYLLWYGHDKHDEFFTAPEVKQAYENWVAHVVTRTNSVNGRKYADDPSVFGWELANEPRMKGGSAFDRNTGWDTHTLTTWADEMSRYIKSLDPNHLVSVGDEGFLDGGGAHWAYKANDGVDHRALSALGDIDFGTFHLYPEDWGTTEEWGEQWIIDHLKVARDVGKPTVLEEYGMKVGRSDDNLGTVLKGWPAREHAYRRWNELMLQGGAGGAGGALAWMLAGNDEPHDGHSNPRYPDYDHYAFYQDDETGRLLGDYAKRFIDASACAAEPRTSATAPSPFVRVRKAPEPVADGWIDPRG